MGCISGILVAALYFFDLFEGLFYDQHRKEIGTITGLVSTCDDSGQTSYELRVTTKSNRKTIFVPLSRFELDKFTLDQQVLIEYYDCFSPLVVAVSGEILSTAGIADAVNSKNSMFI